MRRLCSTFILVCALWGVLWCQQGDPLDSVDLEISRGKFLEAERLAQQLYSDALRTVGVPVATRNRLALRYAELQLDFGLISDATHTIRRQESFLTEPLEKATAGLINGKIQYLSGNYPQAIAEFRKALSLAESAAPNGQFLAAKILVGMSEAHRVLANFSESTANLDRALPVLRQARGRTHDYAAGLAALGDLQRATENLALARKTYSEVSELFTGAPPAQQPSHARALLGLAVLALQEGNLAEARNRLAFATKLVSSLTFNPIAISLLEYEGVLALADKRVKEALSSINTARQMREGMLPKEHPDLVRSQEVIADLLVAQGDRKTAISQLQSAVQMYDKLFGPENLDSARALTRLGELQASELGLTPAEPAFIRASAIRRKILGDTSIAAAESGMRLCSALVDNKQWSRAEPVCRSTVDTFQKRLAAVDPRMQTSLGFLGICLANNGNAVEAERTLSGWLAASEKLNPPDSDVVVQVKLAVARIYVEQRDYTRAQQVLDPLRSHNLPATRKAELFIELGDVHFAQRRFRDAAASYSTGLNLGPSIANADVYDRLGDSYKEEKQFQLAVDPYTKAMAVYEKAGEAARAQTAAVALDLSEALFASGNSSRADTVMSRWLAWTAASAQRPTPADLHIFMRIIDRLIAEGKPAIAEPYLLAVLRGHEQRNDPGSATADILVRLAATNAAQGKPLEAAKFYIRRAHIDNSTRQLAQSTKHLSEALALLERTGKADDEVAATIINLLARNSLAMHKYAESASLLQRSRSIIDKLPAKNDVLLAAWSSVMGRVSQMQSQYEAAAARYQEANAHIAGNAQAPLSLVSELAYYRGSLALSNNKLEEAGQLYQQALDAGVKSAEGLNPDHVEGIAQLYLRQQRFSDAEKLYIQNLEMRKELFGTASSEFGWALHAAADFYLNQKDTTKAIEFGGLALRTFESAKGPESLEVTAALNTLAAAYRSDQKLKEAVDLQRRIMTIHEKVGSQDKSGLQILLTDLADSYKQMNDFQNAATIYERLVKLWEPEGSYRNPNYRSATINLIASYARIKAYGDAQLRFAEFRKQVKGQPDERRLMTDYAKALDSSGNTKESEKIVRELKNLR